MLEFTEFLQDAKKLSRKLTQHFMKQQGCLSFFSALIPNNCAIEDASTISILANSLEQSNDDHLKNYLEPVFSFISAKEFENFKTRVLIGIYLIKWSQYSSAVTYYVYKPLVELFQKDLGIESPNEMEEGMVDACLEALSQFCSYVYENRRKYPFNDLSQRLGATIQLEIHKTRKEAFTEDSSWYGVYTGIVSIIGMNNVS